MAPSTVANAEAAIPAMPPSLSMLGENHPLEIIPELGTKGDVAEHALPDVAESQSTVADVDDAPKETTERAVNIMEGKLAVIDADETVAPDAATMTVIDVV